MTTESPQIDRYTTVYRDTPESMGRVTTPLGDLSFANVFGGLPSMARQLGRRSASDSREGALPFFNQFLPHVFSTLFPGPAARAGGLLCKDWLLGRMRQAYPDEYLKALRAFGEGCGAEVEAIVEAQMVWDLWSLMGRSPITPVQNAVARSRRHSPLLGSISAVLPSEELGPLHLCWRDSAAIDRWDRKTSITFFHPDQGLNYCLISSVGFLTGPGAGMNAAGLSLTVEPGGSGDLSWSGTPLGPAIHEILSHAHTIEEAAAILRQQPSMTPWRYILTEGDTGRAAKISANGQNAQIDFMGSSPMIVSASDASVPGVGAERIARWHRCRRMAMEEIFIDWTGKGDDAAYDALFAMNEPVARQMVVPGHPLNGLSNIGAFLFEPAARRVWIAAGRAPTARRWFIPMTLNAADGQRGGGFDREVRPVKPAGDWETTSPGRSMENLRQGYQLSQANEPAERVLITLEYALALDATRPSLHILAGLMALRTGRARRAEGAFTKARDLIEDASHRAEVTLYLAWALDLQRRRKEARELYAQILSDPSAEADICRWARRARRRPFKIADTRNLTVDFVLATVFL